MFFLYTALFFNTGTPYFPIDKPIVCPKQQKFNKMVVMVIKN
jgi:hypothetical protein